MKSILFPEANTRYVSPKNWDEAKWGPCGDLYVHANQEDQTVTSCYEFDADDLSKIVESNGKLYLTIHGCQPPVVLEVR